MIQSDIYRIWLNDKIEPPAFKKVDGYYNRLITIISRSSFITKNTYLNHLIHLKKWVHASDYLRFLILYEYGGIYLDIDVDVIQKFDDLERYDLFAGFEDSNIINTAVIGAKTHNSIIGEMLIIMEELFEKEGFDYSPVERGPVLFTDVIRRACNLKMNNETQVDEVNNAIILNSKVFYPFHYTEKYSPLCIAPETKTVHYWNHSWK
jgi:hypothetical protein